MNKNDMTWKYGLTIWTFGEKTFEEKCKIAQEIGVDGVEIQGDLSYDPKFIKETLEKYHLEAYSVTPENLNIYSDDASVREEAVDYFLALAKWTKEVGSPRFCLHGKVGEIVGSGNVERDRNYLIQSTNQICEAAEELGLEVVFEILNRYESNMINTIDDALKLIKLVKRPNLKALLDSYHMNIEESDPSQSILNGADDLGIYHIADSNREAVGNGHIPLKQQLISLKEIGYANPIIMEMTAKGPNPFTPIKNVDSVEVVTEYYKSSPATIEWE